MKNSALSLENVEKYFPPAASGWRALLHPVSRLTVPALRGISFEVKPGEVLALVGANGAGKSTLLRILTTLLIPTRGRARVCGFDVAREPAKVRLRIGYHTGGDACFYSRLSAKENLMLFAVLNNISEDEASKRIAEITGPFGLGELLDRQVRTLSTGNVHRLGLARAMLHRPSILILDEPTRSLDPLAAAEFRRFLLRDIVGAHGTTMIFASHTLAEVEQLAGRVAVLDNGLMLACDTLAGLKSATGAETLEESLEILTRRASREAP
ncbi:MAG TPA: ABC transporter ATP-binding protein [Candidatus Acidoferrales bacterium]|nr:ABC transporter ATP-binding protein [Candidatus Acidoferrales bacterium]